MLNKNEFDQIPIPENIDDVIDKGVTRAVKIKKRQRRKKFITTTTGIAAAVAVFSLFCVSNPALAAKIPLIGHIFERVESTVSYKGDFSSTAQVLVTEGAEDTGAVTEIGETTEGVETEGIEKQGNEKQEQVQEKAAGESKYIKTSNGLTVTVSEVYYSTKALYLAMSIKNEEEFPAE